MSIQVKTAANTRANARIDAREIDVSYFHPMLHSEFLVIARDSSAFVLIGCFCRNKGTEAAMIMSDFSDALLD
jgi:hypothetical protein